MDEVKKILQEKNILTYQPQGILTVHVSDDKSGVSLTKDLLGSVVDKKTLLLLSGGSTPKALYKTHAQEETLSPGAVAMVDERYGVKNHDNSNEKMLKDTGLLRYFEMRNIPFYPILAKGESREETAHDYDLMLRELTQLYRKSIGILGIGVDGHTAGIPAATSEFRNQNSEFVTEYNDTSGIYGERVTMTFQALSHLDLFIVLVFGEDKKTAIEAVFSDGSEEEIPGRFFKRPEIARKTLLITDQYI